MDNSEADEWNRKAADDVYANSAIMFGKETPAARHARVIAEIEARNGVEHGVVRSRLRTASAVKARREAVVAMRNLNPTWSYPRLGQFFGLDHSTIIHHLQAAGAWKESNKSPAWHKKIAEINAAMAGNITEEGGK